MELFNDLIGFFGIDMLNETSSLVDLLNIGLHIFGAMFLVAFILRSLFLLLRFGER